MRSQSQMYRWYLAYKDFHQRVRQDIYKIITSKEEGVRTQKGKYRKLIEFFHT